MREGRKVFSSLDTRSLLLVYKPLLPLQRFPVLLHNITQLLHVSDVVSSIDKNVVRDYNYTVYSVQINFEEFKILSGLRIEATFFFFR